MGRVYDKARIGTHLAAKKAMRRSPTAVLCLLIALLAGPAEAQYFGGNKVQVKNFKFTVLKTEHFDIYYYPEEEKAAAQAAELAERWYSRLSQFFSHALSSRQPVILYASHPDFEQTNVIEGFIDEGTGGVTEGLSRRVVLPLAATVADTDHVLGHELVHAFQYDMLEPRVAGSTPLWFIEGMAEYLSLGPRSAQTSMWLRDAVIENKLPKISDLDNPKFFPYRFGHALWAYLGGRFGDDVVARALYEIGGDGETGAQDPVRVIEALSGREKEQLSAEWHAAIRAAHPDARPGATSGLVLGKDSGGRMNLGPALSPDGRMMTFLSERSRLSIDLYLADAATGRVIRKLVSTAADPHFDSLQFLNSAGGWSPDGRRLALAAVRRAKAVLAIVEISSGRIEREFEIEAAGEIFQPAWSPDGTTIAFSAQHGGYTDLFVMDVETGRARALTTDTAADLHPSWSSDSNSIAFVTDRFSTTEGAGVVRYDIASISRDGGTPQRVDTGVSGNATNPQWAADGAIFFISDSRGRPEVFRASGGRSTLVKPAATGVSGITPLSPAISISSAGNRLAATVFHDGGYDLHVTDITAAASAAAPADVSTTLLPPLDRRDSRIGTYLAGRNMPARASTFERAPYRPKLSLVAAGSEIGVATANQFGSYIGGGIGLLFSDVLNQHQLDVSFQANGGARDLAAGTQYVNRTHRFNWGAFVQRTPVLYGGFGSANLDLTTREYAEELQRSRQTFTSAGLLGQYPFSRSLRFELNGSVSRISFDNEVVRSVFNVDSGQLLTQDTVQLPAPESLMLASTAAALVRDTSIAGPTGPVLGQRFRLEAAPTFGDLRLTNVTADFRQYLMPVRPVILAGRAMHVGRYGVGSDDERLTPLFLGYPGVVRGYSVDSFESGECTPTQASTCPQFDQLVGSRLLVLNGEVRAPLVGLFNGKLSYGPIPIEAFAFGDAGVAWTRSDRPAFNGGTREWVRSVGGGVRVNAFGYAILEFAMAKPLDRKGRGWLFVFNLQPGY
jgi:hypothetical protein